MRATTLMQVRKSTGIAASTSVQPNSDPTALPLPTASGCSLIMDASLAPLARKLRMIGVDARVAGAVLRDTAASSRHVALTARQGGGLRRVTICQQRAESELRRAVADGSLRLCAPSVRHVRSCGPLYHLLATDVDAQFAELVEALGLYEALVAGESRCGVCNSAEWRTLSGDEVAGRVPAAVTVDGRVFYECCHCLQIFWPGAKYESTMDSLRHNACSRGGAPRVQQFNSAGYPLNPDAMDCSFYMKNRLCKYAATCKFNHPELDGAVPASDAPAIADS